MSPPSQPRPTRFRTGGISPRKPTRFSYSPDAEARRAMAAELGLIALHGLELTGEITPNGRDELVLTATLVAKADQACIISLVPVRAEISESLRRRYVAGLTDPEGDEIEMPEDDSLEPMPEVIDLPEIAAEALALALPLYPRAPGVQFEQTLSADEGVKPLTDADLKPFAGLQGLAAALSAKGKSGSGEGE
ncbi:MAG: DUF177 domain-containing protein [Tabrizicola sp.]|nr:DUF177 domain-containing protein [Tabrizicola sp.]